MSKNAANDYFQRLHAIDVATGADLAVSPRDVAASVSGGGAGSSSGNLPFDPKQYEERAALLLLNGIVYTTWTSHCDIPPYTAGFSVTTPRRSRSAACSTSRRTVQGVRSGMRAAARPPMRWATSI
jgi:hypothetical protein